MDKLSAQIEALLFIAAKPLALKQLAELCAVDKAAVKQASQALQQHYQASQSGLQLIWQGEKCQLVSAPEQAKLIAAFVQDETKGELSRPSLETLTIIAYRGPVSKTELDSLRGINCALILRNLLMRGLIEQTNSQAEPLYVVSLDFLRFLGVAKVEDLPDYASLGQAQPAEPDPTASVAAADQPADPVGNNQATNH